MIRRCDHLLLAVLVVIVAVADRGERTFQAALIPT